MRRLMRLVETGRIHLTSLFTHRFPLVRIKAGYELTGDVLKVAVPVQ
jgi:threonine dehydrogenase-like Zn-dependent dehydrogenase